MEVLKYSRLNLRLVIGLGFFDIFRTHFTTSSYILLAFSGIDFPDKISSPVKWFKSIWGVLAVGSMK